MAATVSVICVDGQLQPCLFVVAKLAGPLESVDQVLCIFHT